MLISWWALSWCLSAAFTKAGWNNSFLLQCMYSGALSLGLLLATKASLRGFFSQVMTSEPSAYFVVGPELI